MLVYGKAFILRQNMLNKTGWTGVYLKADGAHLLENNVISGALSLLNDGGAVSIHSNGNIIRGNFLLNSVGNVDRSNGCGNTATPCYYHQSYGMGIGAEQNYKNIVVENNTIAGNRDWAIRFNAFTNSTIRNNVLFNNESQILLEDTYGLSSNNTVTGNTVYSAVPEQIAVRMTKATEHGLLDNNFYCNPYSGILFNRNDRNYSFAEWRSNTFNPFNSTLKQDVNSQQCTFAFLEYATTVTGTQMFSNTSFSSNLTGWYGGVYEPATTGMTGGSLKYTNQGTTGYVNYVKLSLTAGQFYRMRFRLKGSALGNVELQINDTVSGNINIPPRFFAYSTSAKNYEYVFKSPVTTTTGQVVFISRSYDAPFYWLDDVSLLPVTAQLAKKPGTLFTNTTAQLKTVTLLATYVDLQGNTVASPLTLNPFSSKILIQQ